MAIDYYNLPTMPLSFQKGLQRYNLVAISSNRLDETTYNSMNNQFTGVAIQYTMVGGQETMNSITITI